MNANQQFLLYTAQDGAVKGETKREQREAVDEDAPPCPQCGQPMRLRNGKNGKFWGCAAYPTCKGTLEVKP